jgi:hypothetical protein
MLMRRREGRQEQANISGETQGVAGEIEDSENAMLALATDDDEVLQTIAIIAMPEELRYKNRPRYASRHGGVLRL